MKDSEEWLRRYDDFLDEWIYPMSERRNKAKMGSRRFKIAILDVGFDENDPFLRGSKERIRATKSWVNGDDDGTGNSMRDESGRGTHAMALLLKMAPEADVYAARIAKDTHSVTEDEMLAVGEVRYPFHDPSFSQDGQY